MTPISQSSAPVSAGVAEGAQARPVVAKSDSGHGADTSVFDGHLEALRSLCYATGRSVDKCESGEFSRQWESAFNSMHDAIEAVQCYARNCRSVATTWGIDGQFCDLHAPEPASGPDEDAAYEEAVGK